MKETEPKVPHILSKRLRCEILSGKLEAGQALVQKDGRITEMDRGGVELCVLALIAPGNQAIPDISQAIAS